jgi:hypothetical protein
MFRRISLLLAAALFTSTCSSAPSAPSDSSVTAPRSTQPPSGAVVPFGAQPITLVVENAAVTSATGAVYTFEVATDAAFASKVQTKDNVAEGSGGQTSAILDLLAGDRQYFWHARATAGGTAGPFSPALSFTIGAAITVNAPVPIGPLTGATTTPRPTLRVANATRTAGAGPITYRFEVSNSPTFASLILTSTRDEGINETGVIPPADLPVNTTLFWRVTAIDASHGVSSAPSATQTIVTQPFSQAEALAFQLGVELWPGLVPPGTRGHATMGEPGEFGVGWHVQTLHYDPRNVFFQSPDVEMLRFFDMMDRGYDPVVAIDWMKANGYPTVALWYPPPDKAVVGYEYVYIASRGKVFVNGIWDVVLRIE